MEEVVAVTASRSFFYSPFLYPNPSPLALSLSLTLSPAVASDCDVALVYEAESSLHYNGSIKRRTITRVRCEALRIWNGRPRREDKRE